MNKQHWKATTEHGTTYTYTGGSVKIDSPRHGQYWIWSSGRMRAVDRKALMEVCTSNAEMWEFIGNSEYVDVPVVGKAIYISNMSEWRLSTEVVAVEILGSEDVSTTDND